MSCISDGSGVLLRDLLEDVEDVEDDVEDDLVVEADVEVEEEEEELNMFLYFCIIFWHYIKSSVSDSFNIKEIGHYK